MKLEVVTIDTDTTLYGQPMGGRKGVRRQLFLRIDDDYFSGSTTITL